VRIRNSEFDVDQHAELKVYQSIGMVYSYCGIQHLQRNPLHPEFIKIPSACNNNMKCLWLCENYDGEIHISQV
jgi:N-acetylneuraminate synthase